MPRLPNVTDDNLTALEAGAFACSQDAHDYAKRIEQGYCDKISEPLRLAVSYLAISRSFAELSSRLLAKASLEEQAHILEHRLRERV